MSAIAALTDEQWLTYEAAAPIMRRLREMKDKSYRRFPIGQEAGHFLRALRVEQRRPNTLMSYETVLRLFTLDHPDIGSLAEFDSPKGIDVLVEFLADHWGEAEPATLDHRRAVLKSFFDWAERTGRLERNPMRAIRAPRRRESKRYLPPQSLIIQLVARQDSLRERAGILLMARLGFRRDELRSAQIRDFDLGENDVLVHGKGGREERLPFGEYKDLRDTLYWHLRERRGEEYLLYPKSWPLRPLSSAGIHNWWRRCLERAELAPFGMHSLRHAAIDEVRRATGDIEAARQLARHAKLATTETYLHATRADLIARMKQVEERRSV